MRFLFTIFLSLATVAIALSPETTRVYDDITRLDNDVLTLIAKLNAYQGGLLTATPLVTQLTAVHLATRKGYYDSLLLPKQLTIDDAKALVEHVDDTLAVDNPRAVAILKTKKPLFDDIGVSPEIKAGLEVLLSDHLAFSDAVRDKLPAEELARGNQVVDIITKALQSGIAYYSS